MASVAVHGLDALEGETAFAFFVLRMREARDRAGIIKVLRYVAPLIPDVETFIEELPGDLDDSVRIIGLPWSPPEAGHAVDAQRRLVESTGSIGVEAAWFFQTGTSLPEQENADDADFDDEDDDDELDEEEPTSAGGRARTRPERTRALTTDDTYITEETGTGARWSSSAGWSSGEVGGETKTHPIELVDLSNGLDDDDTGNTEIGDDTSVETIGDVDDADVEDEDEDAVWSHGPPPRVAMPRFPVDGYAEILHDVDWEDFGIAVKLRGPMVPGEGTVLLGFHTLWLAPYGGRYRNAAVTFDRRHHSAHFWVDRFAVLCPDKELVQHLLWIISKLDEIVPVVHARFAGATMAQKYAGLMGDTSEPFVLGGNPLIGVYAAGGEVAVDAWIADQRDWSSEEVAQMLRELAVEIVTGGEDEPAGEEVDAVFGAPEPGAPGESDHDDEDDEGAEDDDEDDDDDATDDDDDDEDEDDDGAEGDDEEDRGRHITSFAGELLAVRAAAGKLDARVAEKLLPVLDVPERFEHRRRAVTEILGALRYRPAVPALIKILEETKIESSLDAIGKSDFIAVAAAALGAIGDPAAIPALAKVVAAPGSHNDKPRAIAADALASCLAVTNEPRTLDENVLAGLLTTISERNDGELNAETHFAYGRLARQLPPDRRAEARRKLADVTSARDDATALLARQAALVLASPAAPVEAPPRDLQPLLHEALTSLAYDHGDTVHNLRVALRVGEVMPDLVAADDLVWLTRFAERDIRERAHSLLARLGKPVEPAPAFDHTSARRLDDSELVRLIGEAHVVGRAALITEAGNRKLARAKRAIIDACHDVISRARLGGDNLLDPDTRVLEAAMPILRVPPLDDDTIALFDRMLRHSNYQLKWELLQEPPVDERLLGGIFHVLGEKWGWQEKTAKEWLARFEGTEAYEAERARVRSAVDDDDDGEETADFDDDDEDMN